MTGAELAKARRSAEYSREDFAKKLGVCRASVYRWEVGLAPISRLTELAIRQILRDTLPQPSRPVQSLRTA